MKSTDESEESRDHKPENVLQINGLNATAANLARVDHVINVGIGKTDPTINDVRNVIKDNPRPYGSIILSGHGGGTRHANSSNQPNDGKETHTIDLLKDDSSTISNIKKIYAEVDQKPKNILLTSCFAGAVGNDIVKNSNEFEADTNILARGSSKHSTFGDDLIKRYYKSSAKGSVNLTDFAAKEALENPETINIHKIVKDANGKNHTLSVKLIAPKTAQGIAKLDNPVTAKEFFSSEANYVEGSKEHQNKHAVYMIDGKNPDIVLKDNPSLQEAFNSMKKEVKTSSEQATQDLSQAKLQEFKQSLLLRAATQGNHKIINAMIEADKLKPEGKKELATMVNREDSNGWIPLHEATAHANASTPHAIDALKKAGADPDKQNEYGNTAMHIAASNSDPSSSRAIISALERAGANPNIQNKDGATPLHYFAQGNNLLAISALADNGADMNKADNKGLTPLHYAVSGGHNNALAVLAYKGADLNKAGPNGMTPLHYAVSINNKAAIDILIAKGADLNKEDNKGLTPLHHAAAGNNVDAITSLTANGAKVNQKDHQGLTPLNYAADKGHNKATSLLKANGGKEAGFFDRVKGFFNKNSQRPASAQPNMNAVSKEAAEIPRAPAEMSSITNAPSLADKPKLESPQQPTRKEIPQVPDAVPSLKTAIKDKNSQTMNPLTSMVNPRFNSADYSKSALIPKAPDAVPSVAMANTAVAMRNNMIDSMKRQQNPNNQKTSTNLSPSNTPNKAQDNKRSAGMGI